MKKRVFRLFCLVLTVLLLTGCAQVKYILGISSDEMPYSKMVYTRPNMVELRQIMDDGLAYYAKFPQLESLQSIRIFFLTTFISLFFTLLCTVTYRIIRNKVQKIVRKKRSLNKQTE